MSKWLNLQLFAGNHNTNTTTQQSMSPTMKTFYDTALLDYIEVKCNAPILFEEVNYVGWEPLDANDQWR